MGWSRGSEIAADVWDVVRDHVQDEHKRDVAREIIGIFESHDCDTMEECRTLMKDALLDNLSDASE